MTDKRLKAIVRAFRRGILKGGSSRDMCEAVCYPLQSYLSFAYGIETTLTPVEFQDGCVGMDHVFLTLPNGNILDPTADQYNGQGRRFPQVYIGPLPEMYRRWIDGDPVREKAKPERLLP